MQTTELRKLLPIPLLLCALLSPPQLATAQKPATKAARAAKVGKVPPTALPRDRAQALVSAAKIPAFYNPLKLELPPIISAPSAILVDADTGQTLWEKNADVRRPMASTTKIMTGLLLAENTRPDDVITCLDPAITKIEPSSLHVKPWEKFKSKDLLPGFLLRSGNDASVMIAQHLSGSVARFAVRMNERAREIGAVNTHFVNPHGLHHRDHYSTARDLALIAMEAMRNPRFAEAVSLPVRTISRSKNQQDTRIVAKVKRYFYDKFPGADGVKTGYTRAAKHCFVGSATRGDRRLLAVVLGATDSASGDTIPILSWGFARFPAQVIARSSEPVGAVPIEGGVVPVVGAVAADDLHVTYDSLQPGAAEQIRSEVQPINVAAPIEKGQVVGTLTAYLGQRELDKVDLYAAEDIAAAPITAALGPAKSSQWVTPALTGATGLVVLIGCMYAAATAKSNSRRRGSVPTPR